MPDPRPQHRESRKPALLPTAFVLISLPFLIAQAPAGPPGTRSPSGGTSPSALQPVPGGAPGARSQTAPPAATPVPPRAPTTRTPARTMGPKEDVTGQALGYTGDLESDAERKARQAADERFASEPFPPAPRVVRISLQEAVEAALRNNLDIIVERFNPLLLDRDVVSAKAKLYDPTFDSSVLYTNRNTPTASIFFPTGSLNEKITEWGFGITQPTTIGGSVRTDLRTIRTRTNSPIAVLTDTFEPVLQLSIAQDLLRNFGWNVNRVLLRRSMIGEEKSNEVLRSQVINSVFQVQQVYWELVGARENLRVQRLGYRLAADLYRQNEIQVKVGTMAPLDLLQAKAQQAAAETNLIAAENAVRSAQDRLLALTTRDNAMLQESLRVETTERPDFAPLKVDYEESLRVALARRPEIHAANLDIQDKMLVKKAARNAVLPKLEATFTAGFNGLSGDPNSVVNPFSGSAPLTVPVVGGGGGTVTIPGSPPTAAGASVSATPFANKTSFSDATGTFFSDQEFSFWSVGLVITYPIGNRDARAQYSRSKLDLEKSQTSLTRAEQQVTLEVKRAVEDLEALARGVLSTREARIVAEEQLDAENKKLAVGLSTNFEVLTFQEDLTDRRRQEVAALTAYKVALANLEKATGTTLDTLNVEFLEEK